MFDGNIGHAESPEHATMASSRVFTPITWSSVASVTLSSSTVVASDHFGFNPSDWQAALQVHADNQSAPVSGDWVDIWVAYTEGDILNDSSYSGETSEHATFAMRLNTYASDPIGADPCRRTVPIDVENYGFRLLAIAQNAATRNMVIRAGVVTHRSE